MHRKLFVLLFVAFLIMGFTVGCGEDQETEDADEIAAEEQNGEAEDEGEEAEEEEEDTVETETVTAVSDTSGGGSIWGSYVQATVTFENGSIIDVELTEVQSDGFAKDEDYDYEHWHEAVEVLPERFIEADHHEVDAVSEATGTSEKAMQAVGRAMARHKGETGIFDGTYLGYSEIDERDGRNVALVTIENEEITDVALEEYEDVYEGELKEEDYQHEAYLEAREAMPERFIEAGMDGIEDVDAYTEATGSSEGWQEAIQDAVEKASY